MRLLNFIKSITINTPKSANISNTQYQSIRKKEIERLEHRYDFYSIDGICAIPVPCTQVNPRGSVTGTVEYYLRIKATDHKRNKRMDLAIACLRKSNELMPYSNFTWSPDDYLRLVEYLKDNRQFEDARKEESKINTLFSITPKKAKTGTYERDKQDYDLIREHLPDIAPKSFSGYRKMKSTKSKNFIKLIEKAKETGMDIE